MKQEHIAVFVMGLIFLDFLFSLLGGYFTGLLALRKIFKSSLGQKGLIGFTLVFIVSFFFANIVLHYFEPVGVMGLLGMLLHLSVAPLVAYLLASFVLRKLYKYKPHRLEILGFTVVFVVGFLVILYVTDTFIIEPNMQFGR